jgi:hypothetical protein
MALFFLSLIFRLPATPSGFRRYSPCNLAGEVSGFRKHPGRNNHHTRASGILGRSSSSTKPRERTASVTDRRSTAANAKAKQTSRLNDYRCRFCRQEQPRRRCNPGRCQEVPDVQSWVTLVPCDILLQLCRSAKWGQ